MADNKKKSRSFFKEEERQTQTRSSNIIAAKGVMIFIRLVASTDLLFVVQEWLMLCALVWDHEGWTKW